MQYIQNYLDVNQANLINGYKYDSPHVVIEKIERWRTLEFPSLEGNSFRDLERPFNYVLPNTNFFKLEDRYTVLEISGSITLMSLASIVFTPDLT
jgi:hypothetical protein